VRKAKHDDLRVPALRGEMLENLEGPALQPCNGLRGNSLLF